MLIIPLMTSQYATTRPTYHLLSFVLIFLQYTSTQAEGERCGRPGRPVNGTVSTAGRFYFPGERVAYTCLEGFVLFGPGERTCRNNGTWSEDVPLCDFNLARGKRTLQSDTLWSYFPSLAVDGDPDTCSFTHRGTDSRWWQVHLGHKFNVMSVGVTISPGSFQEFTIYVIELLADNKALYKPCTTFKGVFQTHKALFHCNDRLGHPGQFVYIRDDRKEEEYFGLCEVEVFAFRERIPCGNPEVPVGGEVERIGEEKAMYTCTPGHSLDGDSTLSCSSKGKWQGQTPRCREVHCPPPPSVVQGFIEISNFRGVYVFGTEARYTCNSGHVIHGSNTRTCDHTGNWSPESPTCEAVSCGPPPEFENSKVTLLSGSTHWNDIAVYTCIDGYTLYQESGDPVSTCLDKGEWKIINITCRIEDIPATSPIREGASRSINIEQENSSQESGVNVKLIVALAVVAGLLCTVIILVALLLARRRMMSGPGSLSPLVRPSDKQPTNLSDSINHYQYSGYQGDSTSRGLQSNYARRQDILSGPALLQQNLLATLQRSNSYNSRNGRSSAAMDLYFDDNDYPGLGDHDPPYERVRSRSEHSYETIRKKSQDPSIDLDSSEEVSQDPGYETVRCDKDSVGFEIVRKNKDVGYETLNLKKSDCETLSERDPGYETVKETQDPGYETVLDKKSRKSHGYETLKPKKELLSSEDDNPDPIPDILQNLANPDPPTGEAIVPDVPPEIQALYAKVDKSKKKNRQKVDNQNDKPVNELSDESKNVEKTEVDDTPSKVSILPAQDLIKKFNKMSSVEDDRPSKSTEFDNVSGCGTLRPLPPLPDSAKS